MLIGSSNILIVNKKVNLQNLSVERPWSGAKLYIEIYLSTFNSTIKSILSKGPSLLKTAATIWAAPYSTFDRPPINIEDYYRR